MYSTTYGNIIYGSSEDSSEYTTCSISGSGSISCVATRLKFITSAISGTGNITGNATRLKFLSSLINGDGIILVSAIKWEHGICNIEGIGSLTFGANIFLKPNSGADNLIGYRDCDVCGFTYREYELQRRWDGALVCKWDWDNEPEEFYAKVGGMRRGTIKFS